MAHKRKKVFQLKTADQLRVIASPIAIEIVQALRQTGPSAVSELGPVLGKNPNSLHYHFRKLLKSGMIRKTGLQKSGARMESVYDVVAESFVGADIPRDKSLQKLTNAGVESMLRLAKRNWERAGEHPGIILENENISNLRAHRLTARLNAEELGKVNEHIIGITDVFKNCIGNDEGQMCSITVLLTPLKAYSRE